MRVVDRSASIERLIASPAGAAVSAETAAQDDWLVPTIVQLELAKWLAREVDEGTADHVLAFTRTCLTAPLGAKAALLAAELRRLHNLATADQITCATAKLHDAGASTCDAQFEGLSGVMPYHGGQRRA